MPASDGREPVQLLEKPRVGVCNRPVVSNVLERRVDGAAWVCSIPGLVQALP